MRRLVGVVFLLASLEAFGFTIKPQVDNCLNLRATPQGTKLRCLSSNEELKVLKMGNPWVKVRHGNQVGYIWSPSGKHHSIVDTPINPLPQQTSSYFPPKSKPQAQPKYQASHSSSSSAAKTYITPDVSDARCLNFRNRPQGRKMNCLDNGTKLEQIGPRRGNWVPVQYNGKKGVVWSPRGSNIKEYRDPVAPAPIRKPVQEPIAKPVKEPVAKPAPAPIRKPIKQPVQQPVEKPVPMPLAKPTPAPTPQAVPAPVATPTPAPTPSRPEPVERPPQANTERYITPDVADGTCLNFRDKPSGQKVACLRNGSKMKQTGPRQGSWIPVEYDGKKGYVWSPDNSKTKPHSGEGDAGPDPILYGAGGNGGNSPGGDLGENGDSAQGESDESIRYDVASKKIGQLVNTCSPQAVAKVKRQAGSKWVRRCAQIFRNTVACVAKKLGRTECRMDRVVCSGSANRYDDTNGSCKRELERCGYVRVKATDSRCKRPGAANVWARTGTKAGKIHGHIAILDHLKRQRGNHRAIPLSSTPRSWTGNAYCYIPGNDLLRRASN